jgi:hypothetical protein
MTTITSAIPHNTVILEVTNQIQIAQAVAGTMTIYQANRIDSRSQHGAEPDKQQRRAGMIKSVMTSSFNAVSRGKAGADMSNACAPCWVGMPHHRSCQ